MIGDKPELLDVLVAEHVMGWAWVDYPWYDGTTKQLLTDGRPARGDDFNWLDDDGARILFWDMPHFGNDIGAAWTVCEHLNRAEASQAVWIRFHEAMKAPTLWGQSSEEAARCICEHALEAIGVEVPSDY
jgi:hypothetical protein